MSDDCRVMLNTGARNWAHVPWGSGHLAAGYTTGPPGVRWNFRQWVSLPRQVQPVGVNQGVNASGVTSIDTVIDVETGTWTVADVRHLLADLRALGVPRPTVYANLCTVATMPEPDQPADLWLAAYVPAPPIGRPDLGRHGWNLVAWQWADGALWDTSAVFDPYWPGKAPT